MELVSLGPGYIVSIGECMIEFARRGPSEADGWRLGFAGDTLNTALYLARLGERVAYLTAIGDDRYSARMRREWVAEGIDDSLVATRAGLLPGLYLVDTDAAGERSFHYWRAHSAARALFDGDDADALLARAQEARLLYLSGITLSLFADAGRARLAKLCRAVRANGGAVAFDPNFRAPGWPCAQTARRCFAQFAPLADYALPTLADETALHGEGTAEQALRRWREWGAGEVAVKLGAHGALVMAPAGPAVVAAEAQAAPRDTTGAGDAFNAGYLAARLRGEAPAEAARCGHRLAGAVIRHPGAIIPRAAMPEGLGEPAAS